MITERATPYACASAFTDARHVASHDFVVRKLLPVAVVAALCTPRFDRFLSEGAVSRSDPHASKSLVQGRPVYAKFGRKDFARLSAKVAGGNLLESGEFILPSPAAEGLALRDTRLTQPFVERSRRLQSQPRGDLRDRPTSKVVLDSLIESYELPFPGEVFNLETSDGWYVTNGIIAHNCRRTTHGDPEGISRHINPGQPVIAGKKVTVTVFATGRMVVEAEVGTVYPGNLVAKGAHFMSRGAAIVAARRRFRSCP
ncbi:hypothetical protein ACH5A3_41965 [Streptomyces echinatus]|uniref:hypothetical protein n=1 Tax=Streptomyces echinatus TaxID=67293 RepID=UPI0037877DAB